MTWMTSEYLVNGYYVSRHIHIHINANRLVWYLLNKMSLFFRIVSFWILSLLQSASQPFGDLLYFTLQTVDAFEWWNRMYAERSSIFISWYKGVCYAYLSSNCTAQPILCCCWHSFFLEEKEIKSNHFFFAYQIDRIKVIAQNDCVSRHKAWNHTPSTSSI